MTPQDVWTDLFTQLDISLADKVIRTVVVYLAIAVLIRLAGKRLLAQMNSLDLVVVLLLSNVVQNAIIGPDNSLLGGLIGAVVLIVVNDLLDRLAQHVPGVRWLLEGRATTVVSNGTIDQDALGRLGMTHQDLSIGLKRMGADDAREVRHASLEPGGDLLVQLTEQEQSASRGDLAQAVATILERLDAVEAKAGATSIPGDARPTG